MKKLFVLLTLLITALIMLGCSSKYTVDAPYISENGEFTDEQARTIVNNGYYTYSHSTIAPEPGMKPDPDRKVPPGQVGVRVKKVFSTHYYWEENKEKVFYTDTTLQILDILYESEDQHEAYSVGDTVRIIEYYSYKPNGDFISADGIQASCIDTDRTLYMLTVPIHAIDGLENVILSPFVKADTEYMLVLDKTLLVENEKQRFMLGNNEIPHEKVKGAFFMKLGLTELSQYAYDLAKIHLIKYDDPLKEVFRSGSQRYDQSVISAWEKYGDRVKSGE